MRENIPKSMNDVRVSKRSAPQESKIIQAPRPGVDAAGVLNEKDRIEKNPFFKNARSKVPERTSPKGPRSSLALWILAAIFILFVGVYVTNYYSSATVEINPITRSAAIVHDFSAVKDGTGDELVFQFMNLTEERTKDVPATEEKKIQKKASGKVLIFNAYNGESQRLIKNTRLESSDHKIFRIEDSVVVPGAKIVSGKVEEPGVVEAVAYADVSGKEYNLGLADFTVPGFRGDPRYTKFTARSKPDSPVSGGFSGTVKVPTGDSISMAQEKLKQELKQSSVEKARAQIPDGVTFFPGSMVLKFEEVPQDFTSEDTSKVSIRATASIFFFNTELLTKKLVDVALSEYKGSPFLLPDISSLVFTFTDPVNNVVLSDLTKIRFNIAGNAVFVGVIDAQKIKALLAGKDKKDFWKIVVTEHNVGKAEAVVRPMWKSVFPVDPEKITIKIVTQ